MRISDWSSDVCSSDLFGEVRRDAGTGLYENNAVAALFQDLLDLGGREAAEIRARFPQVLRRVGGYNLDALAPNGPTNNLAHLLVGSEGTLADRKSTRLNSSH